MIELPEMPPQIAALPRDDRGYPVPAFVVWIDGKPEFRVASGEFMANAIRKKLCWVCGTPLNPKSHVFVIGGMCAVNKTTAEPPCHEECAEFSAKACPFLSMPKAIRREANIHEGTANPEGIMIRRNPGVTCLWTCSGYELFDDGRGGILFKIPNPSKVRWWSQVRKATRNEIMESINSGLPILESRAKQDGPHAEQLLQWSVIKALRFVPRA